jgi:3-hydroxybutyryl-CoA dehydrogenase
MNEHGYESPAIAGSGAIACGLAAIATSTGPTILLARSDASAWRAEEQTVALCQKLDGSDSSQLRVTTQASDLAECDLVIESVVEEFDVKRELLATLGESAPEAHLATTTSSLQVGAIAEASGHPSRVFGLHVFNPVPRMKLVEVCFPNGADPAIRQRALAWCASLGKTAVEVRDEAGFVVNRLLFPYLFDAVLLLDRTQMNPGEVDSCMTLGAGHPMGPLALLDFVGLDVAAAIGDELFAESSDESHRTPPRLRQMVEEGKLGRKSGAGFYEYD